MDSLVGAFIEAKTEGQVFDAMKAIADKYGLWAEVREQYNGFISGGDDPKTAAWCALYDWDCL